MTKLIVKPITFQFIFSNKFHKKKTKTQILKLVRKKKKITFILKQQSENNKLMKTHHLQRKKKEEAKAYHWKKREILKQQSLGWGREILKRRGVWNLSYVICFCLLCFVATVFVHSPPIPISKAWRVYNLIFFLFI